MKRLVNFEDYLLDQIFEAASNKHTAIILSSRLFDLLKKIDHPIAYDMVDFNSSDIEGDKATLIDYDENDKGKFTYVIPSKLIEFIEKEVPHYNDNLINRRELTRVGQLIPDAWLKFRNSTTIGKVVNKLFPSKYKPNGDPGKDIESFSNEVKLERTKKEDMFGRFKIVDDSDIVHFYNYHQYDSRAFGGSNLGSSCMKKDYCSDYIEFYSDHDGVQLVILMSDDPEQEGKILGRAVLWDIEYINGTKVDRKFMDRIYYIYESDMMLFKEFAKKNGWLYKSNQTMYNNENIVDTIDGSSSRRHLQTKSTFDVSSYYPYMDTMKAFYHEDGYLSNDDGDDGDCYWLEDTSGGYDDRGGIYVDHYGETIREDDLIYCELGDEYRRRDDAIWIQSYDQYATERYVENHLVYSDIEDDYIDDDDSTYSEYHGTYIRSDNAVEVYEADAAEAESFEEVSSTTDPRDNDHLDGAIQYKDTDDYFHEDDEDYFIKAIGLKWRNSIYVHKVWDKDKIFKSKGDTYYNDGDQKEMDELIGQKRIW